MRPSPPSPTPADPPPSQSKMSAFSSARATSDAARAAGWPAEPRAGRRCRKRAALHDPTRAAGRLLGTGRQLGRRAVAIVGAVLGRVRRSLASLSLSLPPGPGSRRSRRPRWRGPPLVGAHWPARPPGGGRRELRAGVHRGPRLAHGPALTFRCRACRTSALAGARVRPRPWPRPTSPPRRVPPGPGCRPPRTRSRLTKSVACWR